MTQFPQQAESGFFDSRPPSQGWEQLRLPFASQGVIWLWFKPASSPQDLVLRIPPETFQACAGALSMRHLLTAVGIPAQGVQSWTLHGLTYDAHQGLNPLLDQPLPPPPGWAESLIAVRMRQPIGATPISTPLPVAPPAAPGGVEGAAFDAIDAEWTAIRVLEGQLEQLRKQLGQLQGRLQSLNRDLNPDERLAADNADKKDWQDARRWLRDVLHQVSRCIREHTVGVTSNAGQRNRFEELYEQSIAPRRSFEGLPAAQREFEAHRKIVQSLVLKMQGTLAAASRDGEQRAQQVLSRIAVKMRNARHHLG